MLAMLRILDNPRQDIPLTAVLQASPIGRLNDEELAVIRIRDRKQPFYQCVWDYCKALTEEKRRRSRHWTAN